MAYQPVEDLLPKVQYNVYKLTTLAFKRALELANGMPKLIETPITDKVGAIALKEIRAGKVALKEVIEKVKKSKD